MAFVNNTTTNNSSSTVIDDNKPLTIVLGCLGTLAILTNAPLLLVLIKRKSQTTPVFCARMSYLVGNMALADCLTGVAIILWVFKATKYNQMIVWISIEASFFTLLLVSIERFIVLSYPLTWPSYLTTRRTFLAITLTWAISLTCGIMVHIYKLKAYFVLTVVFEVLVFTAVTLHTIIIFHLQKRHRKFCQHYSESRAHNINSADQTRATKVILILVVILVVTVMPYILLMQILVGHVLGYWHLSSYQHTLGYKVYRHLYAVELINFIANPIVYAWRMKRYREAFQDTFHSMLNMKLTSKGYEKGDPRAL